MTKVQIFPYLDEVIKPVSSATLLQPAAKLPTLLVLPILRDHILGCECTLNECASLVSLRTGQAAETGQSASSVQQEVKDMVVLLLGN